MVWYHHPLSELSDSRLGRRTLSTLSCYYLTFYELMKGEGKRKKYGGTAVDEEDDNRVFAFLPFYGWFSRYPAISAVNCFLRHGTHTVSPHNQP